MIFARNTKVRSWCFAVACSSFLTLPGAALADNTPSKEEMWKMIQTQQKQIEALTSALKKTEKKVELADQKIEATGTMVENASVFSGSSNTPGWWNKTSIGGYGELHYNAGEKDQIDFHRYVLFVNHEFNDRVRFFSELELEHSLAGEGKNGEVELEQAFVEFDLNDRHKAKAGLFLIPVGILNETHEPPTFFGVERNPVESNIIPTTWWEAGVGFSGEISNGFSYDLAVHSGLNTPTTGGNAFKIRNGRQKVSEAVAEDGAVTGRIRWSGMPGVTLAATGQYQQDMVQGALGESIDATLFETHADIRKNGFGLRALYARWDLYGNAPELNGRDEQVGWYVEPSYRFDTALGEVGVFTRYNEWDNEAGLSNNTEFQQWDVGLNYWPHPDVVLKADVAFLDAPAGGNDDEILNLGVGFQF